MDTFGLNKRTLQWIFLWPRENTNTIINSIFRFLYIQVVIMLGSPCSGALIYQAIHGFQDISTVLETIIGWSDYAGYIFMFLSFQNKFEKIKQIMMDFDGLFEKYCPKNVIHQAEIQARFITKCSLVYGISGVTINNTFPIFNRDECNKKRKSDYDRQRDPCGMSVRHWYPTDVTGPVLFPIVVMGDVIVCYAIALGFLTLTTCLIAIVIHIIAQLRNCRQIIVEIFEKNSQTDKETLKNKIIFCIKYHITIINYSKRVAEAFNVILVIYITVPAMVISTLGYQLTLPDTFIFDKIRYVTHLVGWIGILFLTCFYGQMLINESESIYETTYSSLWYNSPNELQKYVCFIIMRAQRPLTLSVMSLGVLSFQTFVAVMKNSYSYFTLLLTVTNK